MSSLSMVDYHLNKLIIAGKIAKGSKWIICHSNSGQQLSNHREREDERCGHR